MRSLASNREAFSEASCVDSRIKYLPGQCASSDSARSRASRKVLREAIRDVQEGNDPRGVLRGKAGEEIVAIDVADHLAPADTTLAPA